MDNYILSILQDAFWAVLVGSIILTLLAFLLSLYSTRIRKNVELNMKNFRKSVILTSFIVIALCTCGCDSLRQYSANSSPIRLVLVYDSTYSTIATNKDAAAELVYHIFESACFASKETTLDVIQLNHEPDHILKRADHKTILTDAEFIMDEITSRSDGSEVELTGTDVVGALDIAVEIFELYELEAEGSDVVKILVLFSDGSVDPSKNADVVVHFPHLDSFDWSQLTSVNTFWFGLNINNKNNVEHLLKNAGVTAYDLRSAEPLSLRNFKLDIDQIHREVTK